MIHRMFHDSRPVLRRKMKSVSNQQVTLAVEARIGMRTRVVSRNSTSRRSVWYQCWYHARRDTNTDTKQSWRSDVPTDRVRIGHPCEQVIAQSCTIFCIKGVHP
jgi:hypothetical protein